MKQREVYWLAQEGYLQSVRTTARRWFEASSVEQRREQQDQDRGQWVSRAEAARMVGCGMETIQTAIRSGVIERQIVRRTTCANQRSQRS